ncbi:MAG: chromosomal replication initiator protein DnaA [Proteobacteria bacterium]|nr:chromosomal replication initiator protein DnaA [Pseudomonadota bacterium]
MGQLTSKSPPPDWTSVWNATRERLRKELGEAVFDAWISPLVLVSTNDSDVKIGAPKPFARNWVANHYVSRIERAMRSEGGEPTSLSIVLSPPTIGGGLVRETVTNASPAPVSYMRAPSADAERVVEPRRGLGNRMLHPTQTFDTFIAGPANEFSYRAARSFCERDNSEELLLFIHGGFGYGKTHLLNATALEARRRGKRALFLGAEDFMRQFLGALNRKDTLSFKEELRAADMLLIDDLQHICRSTSTVAEFLHTVNAFADLRRKLVIAADRAPAALEALGADVRSRLSGGLVIALDKPERATRLAILKARAAEFSRHRPDGMLPLEVLERIADLEDAAPRDLIGLFTKLATYADLTKKPVTMDVAEETLGQRTAPGRKTSIEDIQRKTAEFYKLDIRDFHSPQRARRVARPRQVAMYLSRELTMRSLPEIGRRFGGRDHTTVLHACRRVAELCEEDPVFKQEVDFLRQVLSRRT